MAETGRLVAPPVPEHLCAFPFLDHRGFVKEGEGGPKLGTLWCCHHCGRWWAVADSGYGPCMVRVRWWSHPWWWRRALRDGT